MSEFQLVTGDCREALKQMHSGSVHCCVTSPPYWGLRDYGCEGQLGLERTPEEYVASMVQVFGEVRRVLRDDGTLWLNLGDSYAGGGRGGNPGHSPHVKQRTNQGSLRGAWNVPVQLKPKDLIGVPWLVAFALQADGWWLRSDIIWSKPNPMPESVTDRPTKAHEYLFLLAKSETYYYDAEAIQEAAAFSGAPAMFSNGNGARALSMGRQPSGNEVEGVRWERSANRNRRSVWHVATQPYPEAHFATYPPALIEPCILAGTSAKGCCSKCGAPWERVTERVAGFVNGLCNGCGQSRAKHIQGPRSSLRAHTETLKRSGSTTMLEDGAVPCGAAMTTGWQPTCDCNADVKPCTVLDPFCGSGTTGEVAIKHGRNFVGIELNPQYVELARTRITNAPLSLGLGA